jgi:Protein of unknown function (DUF3142)
MGLPANKKLRLFLFLAVIIGLAIGLRLKQTTQAVFSVKKSGEAETALQTLPSTILWAWERPERLDFIDTKDVGVAFLARTVRLRGLNVSARPRLQPLVVAKGTKLVAVVRIESDQRDKPALSESQLNRAADEIVQTSQLPDVLAIQIDFDAKASERDFYHRLLLQVREHLPQTMPLSITALASWCAGDNWLAGLPIDEAVPMAFRMGLDSRQFRSRLNTGDDPFATPCNVALGVSTDELITPPRRKRLYIFSSKPWTPDSVTSTLETYAK